MNKVVQIGAARVKFKHQTPCQHNNLSYDLSDKTIECNDCGRFIEAFEAFLTIVRNFQRERDDLNDLKEEVSEIRKKGISLLAARLVENAWRRRKTVPTCPHCREAIFPFDGFGKNFTNKEFALAKRNRLER